MGTTRTSIAWLVASLTVGLVSGLPHVTLANDAGPGKEVRAIRRDLPTLLANTTENMRVTAVAVDGNDALAEWDNNGQPHVDYLFRRFDRWWFGQQIYGYRSEPAPSLNALASEAWLPYGLVKTASTVLPAMIAADAATPTPPPTPAPPGTGSLAKYSGGPCVPYDWVNAVTFTRERQPMSIEHYKMTVGFAKSDAPDGAHISVSGRAPTEAESWMTDGGNSYFFFTDVVHATAAVHVAAGTTIDVWFPFVLDPSLHYALTLAHADRPIGPIDGTLKNNVVHFVLPALTLTPGAELNGEIEGDAWPHYAGS